LLKSQHTAKAKSVFDRYAKDYLNILDSQSEFDFKGFQARFA